MCTPAPDHIGNRYEFYFYFYCITAKPYNFVGRGAPYIPTSPSSDEEIIPKKIIPNYSDEEIN